VATASRDQKGEPSLQKLAEDFASSPVAKHASARILQSGESKIFCEMSDNLVNEFFDREEDRELIRSVAASFIAVPIRARDGVLGAITMVNTQPERKCGPDELSLAEELAQRAALALDNARLYRAAQNARTEAEHANSAKDQFLAMLSHELRTPLMPVLTSILAIENEQALSESVHESLQMIRRNVELEARLIDDLLDLTRISKGKVQLNFEIVDAHKLLRNALEICQEEIAQKRLAFHFDLTARKVRLKADPARLQQIFWNLIKNAVKFTPKGGQLSVRTSNDSTNQLCVEVVDTGVGIDPEALPKIFDAFEQGGSTQLGGLGLGLAISKALVEIHKGTITAESAGRNKGAKFTAFFPTSMEKSDEVAPAASLGTRERQSMRILLVEDHEDTNRSLTNLLRRRGYHVQSAGSLRSALDLSAKEEFDVLISDLGLPDGSGIDLMQTMRSERPLLGIALTGFGMEDDIRKSRDAGFKHHLVKPIDLNKLDSLIQDAAAANTRA
jgi:signal transduction histidine kinase/CheY-like chemotaxis protein